MRKTVQVVDLIEQANNFLLMSDESKRAERLGVCTFIENILHDAGAYAGFNYLYQRHLDEAGVKGKPGIIFDDVDHNHQYPDDSRRFYFVHRKLVK